MSVEFDGPLGEMPDLTVSHIVACCRDGSCGCLCHQTIQRFGLDLKPEAFDRLGEALDRVTEAERTPIGVAHHQALEHAVAELTAAVDSVRALHARSDFWGNCSECHGYPYPCSTVEALDRRLS